MLEVVGRDDEDARTNDPLYTCNAAITHMTSYLACVHGKSRKEYPWNFSVLQIMLCEGL